MSYRMFVPVGRARVFRSRAAVPLGASMEQPEKAPLTAAVLSSVLSHQQQRC